MLYLGGKKYLKRKNKMKRSSEYLYWSNINSMLTSILIAIVISVFVVSCFNAFTNADKINAKVKLTKEQRLLLEIQKKELK